MQQGQLPAALTVHVIESIIAQCYVLNCVYSHSRALPPALQLEQRQQRSPMQRESGESHTPRYCGIFAALVRTQMSGAVAAFITLYV
jgi:hypothetical protein